MPLVGLIDDNGTRVPWELIEDGFGDFPDPLPFLKAFCTERTPYCGFSVTELLNDPLQLQLVRRFDYYESVDQLMDRIFGTCMHAAFEASNEEGFRKEERLLWTFKMGKKLGDVTIGGTFDLLELREDRKILWDYKTLSAAKLRYIAKGKADAVESWTKQLNIYAYLLWKNEKIKVDEAFIRAIVRDWRFYEFRQKGKCYEQYPRGAQIPIDVWPLKDTETFVKERIRLHAAAAQLTDEELHSLDECDTWNGIRCDSYCALSSICPYRLREKQGE